MDTSGGPRGLKKKKTGTGQTGEKRTGFHCWFCKSSRLHSGSAGGALAAAAGPAQAAAPAFAPPPALVALARRVGPAVDMERASREDGAPGLAGGGKSRHKTREDGLPWSRSLARLQKTTRAGKNGRLSYGRR